MIFILQDIVFQNDRYYLLFDEQNATAIADSQLCWDLYVDHVKYYPLSECTVSETLRISDYAVIECKKNLIELERIFRKTKLVEICPCVKSVNNK